MNNTDHTADLQRFVVSGEMCHTRLLDGCPPPRLRLSGRCGGDMLSIQPAETPSGSMSDCPQVV